MATNAREAGSRQRQDPSHRAAVLRRTAWRRTDIVKASGGLSNSGSAIFLAMADQMSSLSENAASPAPTMAPISACVVDTGRLVRDAIRTQIIAPVSTASANVGGMAVPGAMSPLLKVFTIALATTIETQAPKTVHTVPHTIAV